MSGAAMAAPTRSWFRMASQVCSLIRPVSKFLRGIVDWDVSERMSDDRTLAALKMFTGQRKQGEGLTHHCDQGGRETDGMHEALLKEHGFWLNVNGVGAWYDIAPMASVLGTPNRELFHRRVYRTKRYEGVVGLATR